MSRLSPTAARVVQYSRFGDADVLEIVEVERPKPGAGEVLVEVLSAGVNHMEAFIRQGQFDSDHSAAFPMRQGTDFSGVVVALGEASPTSSSAATWSATRSSARTRPTSWCRAATSSPSPPP